MSKSSAIMVPEKKRNLSLHVYASQSLYTIQRAYTLGTTKSLGLTTICPVTFLIASVFKNIISVKLAKFSLTSVYLFRTGMPQSDLYY